MKKIYSLLVLVLFCMSGYAQYHMIPWINAGTNPKGLNQDAEYPPGGGLPAGWTTLISGTNTAWSANQNVPFPFDFNGETVTAYKVHPSGVLTFTTDATQTPTSANAALPSTNVPDKSICVWGMTLNQGDYVVSKTFGTMPNRQHWVMFNSATQSGLQTGWAYWSIVLEEGSNKIYIVDQRNLCVQSGQNCNGKTALTAGIQINGTTAVSIPGSPALAHNAGNDPTPIDNSFYEFIPGSQPANNVAAISVPMAANLVMSNGPFDIKLNLRNLGSSTLSSLKMYYSINGGTAEMASLSGLNIASLATSSITHTTKWSPSTEGAYTIRVWVEEPNGAQDADPTNNEATVSTSAWENVLQRKPLYEVFSSSTCGPCAPGNVNMKNVLQPYDGDHVTVKYQQNFPGTGDPYATAETVARRSYYAINSIPRLEIDGQWDQNASSLTANIHNQFKGIPAFVGINATVDYWATSAKVNVEIDPIANFAGNNVLQVVIMEKKTFNNVKTNGEVEFENVVKKMLPNQNGTVIGPLNKGQKKTYTLSHTFFGNYRLPANGQTAEYINHATEHSVEEFGDLIVAVWVQGPDKKVLQSAYATEIKLSTPEIEKLSNNVVVYPNPASNEVYVDVRLHNAATVQASLVNVLGQQLMAKDFGMQNAGDFNASFPVQNLAPGMYFMNIQVDGSRITRQVQIVH